MTQVKLARKTLRSYQKDGCRVMYNAYRSETKRGLAQVPTGGGKSLMIAAIVKVETTKHQGRVLVVSHSAVLLDQNRDEYLEYTGLPPEMAGRIGAGSKENLTAPAVFGVNISAANYLEDLGDFSLIIIDEAHRINISRDSKYSEIIDHHQEKGAAFLGFTATPFRLDNGDIYGDGNSRFAAKKLFPKLDFKIEEKDLIGTDHLVDYRLPTNRVSSLIEEEHIKETLAGVSKQTANHMIDATEISVNMLLGLLSHERLSRNCTMVFCCSIAHVKSIEKALNNHPDNLLDLTVAIHSKDGRTKEQKKEVFKEIREGAYTYVLTVDALTTGFNAPIVDCVALLRPTYSASLYTQIVGRGLRPYPGKEDCLLIDMAGNYDRFGCPFNPKLPEKNSFGRKSEDNTDYSGVLCMSCFINYVEEDGKICKQCASDKEMEREERKLRLEEIKIATGDGYGGTMKLLDIKEHRKPAWEDPDNFDYHAILIGEVNDEIVTRKVRIGHENRQRSVTTKALFIKSDGVNYMPKTVKLEKSVYNGNKFTSLTATSTESIALPDKKDQCNHRHIEAFSDEYFTCVDCEARLRIDNKYYTELLVKRSDYNLENRG